MKKTCLGCLRPFAPARPRQKKCERCDPLSGTTQDRRGGSGGRWESIRRQLYARCGGCCERCGRAMVLREPDATPDVPLMHAAHREQFADTRDDSLDNLDAACEPCHRAEHYGPEEQ